MNISPTTLSLDIANFQSRALNSLFRTSSGFNDAMSSINTSVFASLDSMSTNPLFFPKSSPATELPSLGRNLALADPESAYKMMSVINNRDVSYKAQFSELSQMQSYVSRLQDTGQNLGNIESSTHNEQIKAQLIGFTEQYNSWVKRFDADMQTGGILDGTQAAEVAVYELDQSIKNIFNGATDGLHGLKDIGVNIDSNTRLATFESSRLDWVLANNKQGAINTIQEFSANFAKSASLLNAENNFIPSQLNNLNGAIRYIADNKSALQAEFGTGTPAKPAGLVAQALTAYNQTYALA